MIISGSKMFGQLAQKSMDIYILSGDIRGVSNNQYTNATNALKAAYEIDSLNHKIDFENYLESRKANTSKKLFYRPSDVQEMLGIKKSALYKRVNCGNIPAVKIDGVLRIKKGFVDQQIQTMNKENDYGNEI
jgi:hypothetical protein